jgi:hypothetical protein
MSYNAQAEVFSLAAETPWLKPGFFNPSGWTAFHQVYSDIADATSCEQPFRISDLVGQLPSIAHMAPKTQAEILRVVVRDMVALPMQADRLVRVKGGWAQWRFADRRESA